MNQKSIAAEVGVNPSTISRELSRNTGGRGCRPMQAHEKAQQHHRDKPKTRRMGEPQKAYIQEKIKEGWSLEQISGRMEQEGVARVSYESIYRYLLSDQKSGGSLYTYLRHKNKKYRKRYGSQDHRIKTPNEVFFGKMKEGAAA